MITELLLFRRACKTPDLGTGDAWHRLSSEPQLVIHRLRICNPLQLRDTSDFKRLVYFLVHWITAFSLSYSQDLILDTLRIFHWTLFLSVNMGGKIDAYLDCVRSPALVP